MWAGVSWTQHLVQMEITLFTQAGQNVVSFCTSSVMNKVMPFLLWNRKDRWEVV